MKNIKLDTFLAKTKKIIIISKIEIIKKAFYTKEFLSLDKVEIIYALISGNNIYIGKSSDSVRNRIRDHITTLLRGEHHNKKLQVIFDSDPFSLELEILENSRVEILNSLERKYVEYYRKIGFNVLSHERYWK